MSEQLIAEKWPDAVVTDSGLRYIVKNLGDAGVKPRKEQIITAHYTGTLVDGTKFDSSVDRNQPFQFPLGVGGVIAGWDEAFADMTKGEERILIIPPELAYGAGGYPGVIPPNSFLIFDVELLDLT